MRVFSIAIPALLSVVTLVSSISQPVAARQQVVDLRRIPDGGLQPELAVGATGVVHLAYLTGDPAGSDVFYVRSADDGRTFSPPVRVNSEPGSAIAAGVIRGAQIAVGRSGRVHVAWNGSNNATPKPPLNPKTGRTGMPMLYARSTLDGSAFEPQRNLMTRTTDLDGGGSIAVDERGVYVAWHANGADGEGGEAARRVWLSRSTDDGATFERERAVSDSSTGACGCCAVRLTAASGQLRMLYRSATNQTHRDIFALVSGDGGKTFESRQVHEWEIGACPMTSMSIAGGRGGIYAWETDGQVFFSSAAATDPPRAPELTAKSETTRRKHPRLAVNGNGTVLLVWTEVGARTQPGVAAWQVFGTDGTPQGVRGSVAGVPASSFATAIARRDGGFTVFY